MIAITTENGILRIAGEIPIPKGRHWSAERAARLIGHIERFVFAAELQDRTLPHNQTCDKVPPRKANLRSSLVVVDPLNDEGP